jgi:hypothetical protein
MIPGWPEITIVTLGGKRHSHLSDETLTHLWHWETPAVYWLLGSQSLNRRPMLRLKSSYPEMRVLNKQKHDLPLNLSWTLLLKPLDFNQQMTSSTFQSVAVCRTLDQERQTNANKYRNLCRSLKLGLPCTVTNHVTFIFFAVLGRQLSQSSSVHAFLNDDGIWSVGGSLLLPRILRFVSSYWLLNCPIGSCRKGIALAGSQRNVAPSWSLLDWCALKRCETGTRLFWEGAFEMSD